MAVARPREGPSRPKRRLALQRKLGTNILLILHPELRPGLRHSEYFIWRPQRQCRLPDRVLQCNQMRRCSNPVTLVVCSHVVYIPPLYNCSPRSPLRPGDVPLGTGGALHDCAKLKVNQHFHCNITSFIDEVERNSVYKRNLGKNI